MRKSTNFIILWIIIFVQNISTAQNCNVFLYQKDTLQYEACLIAEDAYQYYQYSREYQEILDKAIEKCPHFSYAYLNKSTAYLKSGDFITWKYLIDKAVEYDTRENIGYRGWCKFQFFRDYQGAIDDIESLEAASKGNIGYSAGGQYHLKVAKALCYKQLGDVHKAITIMEEYMVDTTLQVSVFDHFHLGVMYLEIADYDNAITQLNLQSAQNDLAENQYYLALCYQKMGNDTLFNEHIAKAKEMYLRNQKMVFHYTEPIDRVYLKEIESAMEVQKDDNK
jgi:tetratricopeptide (TPR) repeat protein